jgi:hypothetical protein
MASFELDSRRSRKSFSRTVNNGTDNLMYLARPGGLAAGESSCESRSEVLLDGLEGTLNRCRSAEGRPQRPLEAAISSH